MRNRIIESLNETTGPPSIRFLPGIGFVPSSLHPGGVLLRKYDALCLIGIVLYVLCCFQLKVYRSQWFLRMVFIFEAPVQSASRVVSSSCPVRHLLGPTYQLAMSMETIGN